MITWSRSSANILSLSLYSTNTQHISCSITNKLSKRFQHVNMLFSTESTIRSGLNFIQTFHHASKPLRSIRDRRPRTESDQTDGKLERSVHCRRSTGVFCSSVYPRFFLLFYSVSFSTVFIATLSPSIRWSQRLSVRHCYWLAKVDLFIL